MVGIIVCNLGESTATRLQTPKLAYFSCPLVDHGAGSYKCMKLLSTSDKQTHYSPSSRKLTRFIGVWLQVHEIILE